MTRPRLAVLIALGALIVAGCAGPEGAALRGLEPIPAGVERDEQRREDLRNVMQAKLVYANALLEAIALEDAARVEYNAMELAWLSRQSDWQVHDTVAYGVFSERFQQVTDSIAERARAGDISGASASYQQMTATCLDCHAYLRREGLVKDLPGVVASAAPRSMLPPW